MKISKLILLTLVLLLFIGITSCSEEEIAEKRVEIPERFSVDIPSSISKFSGGLNGRVAEDGDGIIQGEDIYAALPHFIRLGEASAEIIEYTLLIGAVLETANLGTFTTEETDDERSKRVEIVKNVTRGGADYEFEMTMTDVADGELGLQLLWNTDPVSGVGILRPYYIDRIENKDLDAYVRINYSEDDPIYDATMTVSLSGIEKVNEGDLDNLKMFVGRSGDIVDVFGNSNHPGITIIDPQFTGGRNYAFVGRGDESNNLGVVKLALPPSNVDNADVLNTYSVYNVLDQEIKEVSNLDQTIIDAVLAEAGTPAYFDAAGFISADGTVPDGFTEEFVDLDGMSPFVPVQVRDLEIAFLK